MLPQLPPRAEAMLTCNYEPRVVKGWVGHVSGGVKRVVSSKCVRVASLQSIKQVSCFFLHVIQSQLVLHRFEALMRAGQSHSRRPLAVTDPVRCGSQPVPRTVR